VTFIQRFSSALRLNVHFHCLVPDGVFAAGSPVAGASSFLALPPPRDEEVEAINRRIACKTLLLFRSIDPAERRIDDDALERLYAAALQPPRSGFHLRASRPRCSSLEGFSLHADVRVAARDRGRLERVCRYGLRPPLAHERLERLPSSNLAPDCETAGARIVTSSPRPARVPLRAGVSGDRAWAVGRSRSAGRGPASFSRTTRPMPGLPRCVAGNPRFRRGRVTENRQPGLHARSTDRRHSPR
jgi:hypothetical protein